MNKVSFRHVLLAMLAAVLSFGGSFTCSSSSGHHDHDHDDDNIDTRDRER